MAFRRKIEWGLAGALMLSTPCLQAAPRVKVIKVAVSNPGATPRKAQNVVLPVETLARVAPGFKAGDAIVTTSDAATLEQDAATLQTVEIPSQADDLDGAGK